MNVNTFQRVIFDWYRCNGRNNLPWRKARNPYRILISEVMLQQTQVSRVIPKYRQFLCKFPTIEGLGRAPLKAVLLAWQGMGYNRRALYLKRTAAIIQRDFNGRIPSDPEMLRQLPGIGPGTAGAIAAFAFGKRVAFIETNIRRVFIHFFFADRRRIRDAEILKAVAATLPARNIRAWYYALMDYGALALKGIENPNRRSSQYARQPKFTGSTRELRGKIMTEMLRRKQGLAPGELQRRVVPGPFRTLRFKDTLGTLIADGLLATRRGRIVAPR